MINELRIGNIVLRKNSNDEWKETTVNLTYMGLIYEFPEDYKPIPLTEDWFEKLGFELNDDYLSEDHLYKDWVKKGVRIQLPFLTYSDEDGEVSIDIKSVHQLQNLFYSLTGEELTIQS